MRLFVFSNHFWWAKRKCKISTFITNNLAYWLLWFAFYLHICFSELNWYQYKLQQFLVIKLQIISTSPITLCVSMYLPFRLGRQHFTAFSLQYLILIRTLDEAEAMVGKKITMSLVLRGEQTYLVRKRLHMLWQCFCTVLYFRIKIIVFTSLKLQIQWLPRSALKSLVLYQSYNPRDVRTL